MKQTATRPFSFEINGFKTVNTRDNAVTMKDFECPVLLNFMPIGDALYSVDGPSDTLASTPNNTVIIRMFDVNIGGTMYKIVATSDGALYRFNDAWTRTTIAAAGTFTGDSTGPFFAQWKTTHLLIIDPNGYWSWDGTTLTNIAAITTGSSIAVYAERVWIGGYGASKRTVSYSFLNTYDDFSTLGSGSYIDNYASLRHQIISLVPIGDYLYIIGDHAVHILYGVQTLLNGLTAYQVSDAIHGVGTPYPDSIQTYGETVFLVNKAGVFAISGSSYEMISSYIDGTFPKVDFSFAPVAFFANIKNKRVYCILLRVQSPLDGATQKWFACFYEGRWFFVFLGTVGGGSGTDYIFAGEKETADDNISYATYDNHIIQLFNGNTYLTKKIRTKAFNFGMPIHDKQVLRVGVLLSSLEVLTTSFTATVHTDSINPGPDTTITFVPNVMTWQNASGGTINWQVSGTDPNTLNWTSVGAEMIGMTQCDGRGKRIAIDYQETSVNSYTLNGFLIEGQVGADW